MKYSEIKDMLDNLTAEQLDREIPDGLLAGTLLERKVTWPMDYREFSKLGYNGTAWQIVYGYWSEGGWDEGGISTMHLTLESALDAVRKTDPIDVVRSMGRVPLSGETVAIRLYFDTYTDSKSDGGYDAFIPWGEYEWYEDDVENTFPEDYPGACCTLTLKPDEYAAMFDRKVIRDAAYACNVSLTDTQCNRAALLIIQDCLDAIKDWMPNYIYRNMLNA